MEFMAGLPLWQRVIGFVGIAVVTHLTVVLIRRLAYHLLAAGSARQYAKLRTVGTLAASILIFTLYFLVGGLILRELGVSLTAYLASASVVGLAIGFGSQGVVQDVVTGLTFIFSDLLNVGDLVEVSGQTGIVKGITMRFIELQNAMGASVYLPNRTVTSVINYPRGYVRCIVDVTLLGDDDARNSAEQTAETLMRATHEQFPGILIAAPSIEGRIRLNTGREVLRVKFRIWPGRGAPIESVYVKELTAELQRANADFQPWMIALSYEVEKPTGATPVGKISLWGK